jgi:hypothetical protein
VCRCRAALNSRGSFAGRSSDSPQNEVSHPASSIRWSDGNKDPGLTWRVPRVICSTRREITQASSRHSGKLVCHPVSSREGGVRATSPHQLDVAQRHCWEAFGPISAIARSSDAPYQKPSRGGGRGDKRLPVRVIKVAMCLRVLEEYGSRTVSGTEVR